MGESNTYRIPRIASSTTDRGDLKGSATDATVIDDYATIGGIYTFTDDPLNNQMNFVKMTVGSIPAGEPYLLVPTAEEITDIMKVVMPGAATNYDLTLADGSNAHGTVTLSVGGSDASQAQKDDVVTITVTPNEGYSAKDVTVRSYTTWEAASEILTSGGNNPELVSDITVTKNETDGTWQFTMPEANVWIKVTYVADKSELNDAIDEAEAYYESIKDSNPEPASALKTAIDAAKEVKNNNSSTLSKEQVDAALAALTVAKTTAEGAVLTETKNELSDAIAEAENYYNSISESNPTAATALQTAINTAKGVQANPDATQEQVDAALAVITVAKTTAEEAVLTETKTALDDAITEEYAVTDTAAESRAP